ncbi:MAG: excinuclease ABC subunit UvrA [Limnochordaceae bacterium]|nr:excinuclease ABC subunit UvrA [Limnochordaceae bacterium]
MAQDRVVIRGARQHNLKNIDLEIPRGKLVVFTGLSGSGKSSLAFDTIYAEGQRRYVESLSSYARQFLGQMNKPDVDFIEGLSPAISIDQKTTSHNPRSTVGTVTEIYDYLRLLWARIGHPHCPQCGRPVTQQSAEQIVDQVMGLPEGSRILVLAPLARGRKGEFKKVLEEVRRQGFVRVRVDGQVYEVDAVPELDKKKKHTLEIVVDRLVVRPDVASRLTDSLETALRFGDGIAAVLVLGSTDPVGTPGETSTPSQDRLLIFSEKLACPVCGISLEELSPRLFSFNSPYGACPQCDGLGVHMEFDPELVLDMDRPLLEGGVRVWAESQSQWIWSMLVALCRQYDMDSTVPLRRLSQANLDRILYGTGEETIRFPYVNMAGEKKTFTQPFPGVIPWLKERLRQATSDWARQEIEQYMTARPCERCHGQRLKPEALAVTVGERSIAQVAALTVREALTFFDCLQLSEKERYIAHQVLKEIRARLGFLVDVGLDYLTLDRAASTLSGGEAQRIRLATQIGSGLTGVIYILDEPSIGLHQRDNRRLLRTLQRLRDQGNTLIVVEHDEETIRSADWVVDIGPGAGAQGGRVVAEGPVEKIMATPESITGQYLSGRRRIEVPKQRRSPAVAWLEIRGAREHNLKNIDVRIPLGVFVCVTGVSGSGKSTLINEILYRQLAHDLNGAATRAGEHDAIIGEKYLDKVINIDQSPIGRTPRSNPATYVGLFDLIRQLFAETPDARMRGYKPGRFSFNLKGGRCEACQGDGIIKIEMHFLPDVYVPCESCKGKRYNRETLEVRYKGKNIADVLAMRVDEALGFFQSIPQIARKLQTLYDVGLGYIELGQPATTLSGGEAQRVKLATELSRRATGRTLYILDEPTTGLHIADVEKLLGVLHRLVDAGNTVVVIEHNLDVIKTADYLIDLGPEGGDRGGEVVATGTPEEVAMTPQSYTGLFLRPILGLGPNPLEEAVEAEVRSTGAVRSASA